MLFKTCELIKSDPDIYQVLKKLHYRGWEDNFIEKHYIFPLQRIFNKMRANLMKQYSIGMGFWHYPLKHNEVFV